MKFKAELLGIPLERPVVSYMQSLDLARGWAKAILEKRTEEEKRVCRVDIIEFAARKVETVVP